MRKDMHKVVIERPRWSPGPNKMGRAANLPDDLLPKYQGMRRPYKCRKAFTDLLGPLRRWLGSQVGRPWNDVYSEACAVIKPDSIVRMHIKTHMFQFVARHTFMHAGEVCVLDGFNRRPEPVNLRRYGGSDFYVHPESGLLVKAQQISIRDWRLVHRPPKPSTMKWLDGLFALRQIKGIWYMCQFRKITPYKPFKAYDHALGQVVGVGGLLNREGTPLHCYSKRQLSRGKLRRYELANVVVGQQEASPSVRHARIEAGASLNCLISW